LSTPSSLNQTLTITQNIYTVLPTTVSKFHISSSRSLVSSDMPFSETPSSAVLASAAGNNDKAKAIDTPVHEDEEAGSDVEMENAPSSDVGVSKVARLLKKQQKEKHLVQVVQSKPKAFNNKSQKKHRKPLDASAKKDHSKVATVAKLVDREFDKTMTELEEIRGDKGPEPRRAPSGLSDASRSLSKFSPISPSSPVSSVCSDSPVSQPLSDEETAMSASSVFVDLPDNPFSLLEENNMSEAVETASSTDDMEEIVEEIIASSPEIAIAVENVLGSPSYADDEASSPIDGDVDCLSISEEPQAGLSNMEDSVDHHKDVEKKDKKPAQKKPVDERPFNFLLFPNAMQYPSVLSRDEEAALVAMHVGDFTQPVFSQRAQRQSRAERQAAVTAQQPCLEDIVVKTEDQDTSVHKFAVKDLIGEEHNAEESSISETLIAPAEDISAKQRFKAIDDNNPSSDEDTTLHPTSKSGTRTRRDSSESKTSQSSVLTIEELEREEHLANATYIGSTSLEDFIDKLEFDPEIDTTTKQDICTAFAILSAEEFEAIQHRPADHIAVDELHSLSAQRKIKLGKTSLHSFLRLISYEAGSTTVNAVMEAFHVAAASDRKISKKLRLALQLAAAASS
jgi:hypothetical protein